VPWLLETSIALELLLGRRTQAAIVALLLVVNGVIGFVEERRARDALAALRQRLALKARALRDGEWRALAAEELVPGDVVRVRMGDIAPADLRLLDGGVQLDQSALTGESLAVDAGAGATAWAGSIVRRGEADAEVTAIGAATWFGRTAALVREARATGHIERLVVRVVRALVAVDAALAALVVAYALVEKTAAAELVPFVLMLLVASVPVALPATFTLATALAAHELAKRGVLVARLSSIEAAAAMDVLCSDKTGTITRNALALKTVEPAPPHDAERLLQFAIAASDRATQDPIDLAILDGARERSIAPMVFRLVESTPFDPATRRSEVVLAAGGAPLRIVKGAPKAIGEACGVDLATRAEALAATGERVIAVAAGEGGSLAPVGLLGFADPPRDDAASTIRALGDAGVRVLMVTGDGAATARAVAAQVGIDARDVFAGVFPEGKFALVKTLQSEGRVVGMTGDGVNDAPALKQADVGIAVEGATDVARAAAGVVLTEAGLPGILAAVETGRRVFQRMLTYTLNKVVKTFHVALFLGLGYLLFGCFVTTPRHVVLLLLTNDFATMSLSRDRVTPSTRPDRWDVRALSLSAFALAAAWLVFSFAVFLVGRDWLRLDLPSLQTLNLLGLAMSGHATIYLVRERRRFWRSRPSGWLTAASLAAVAALAALAWRGILLAPVRPSLIGALAVAVAAFALALDQLKVLLFRLTGIGKLR